MSVSAFTSSASSSSARRPGSSSSEARYRSLVRLSRCCSGLQGNPQAAHSILVSMPWVGIQQISGAVITIQAAGDSNMKARPVHYFVFILFLTTVVLADATRDKRAKAPTDALVEASAGFNDAEGLNADKEPDSPYPLGKKNREGGKGEPGWAGPWPASE